MLAISASLLSSSIGVGAGEAFAQSSSTEHKSSSTSVVEKSQKKMDSKKSSEKIEDSINEPFDAGGNFIPIPVNPWPSVYELQRDAGASVNDIGIAPPVNPYPANNSGDTSLGGYNPNKDYSKGTSSVKKANTNKSSKNSKYKNSKK